MNSPKPCCKTSVGKKQIVATTGLLLILFIIGHLAGNFFIYGGPKAFNSYAEKLASFRPALYFIEFGLLIIFLIHMFVTAQLVLENIKARGGRYSMQKDKGARTWASKIMPYTGTIIVAFLVYHLIDFTFSDHNGPRSILNDGRSYGLYGVVYNSFKDPFHSTLYILAIFSLGFHLSHGVQSFMQTFGFNNAKNFSIVKKISEWFAVLITISYCSIPFYIMLLDRISY